MPDGASTARLLQPNVVETRLEGDRLAWFRKDAAAGLTVGVFAVSAPSGSRLQIGGRPLQHDPHDPLRC
jgi:hypothetical protein